MVPTAKASMKCLLPRRYASEVKVHSATIDAPTSRHVGGREDGWQKRGSDLNVTAIQLNHVSVTSTRCLFFKLAGDGSSSKKTNRFINVGPAMLVPDSALWKVTRHRSA